MSHSGATQIHSQPINWVNRGQMRIYKMVITTQREQEGTAREEPVPQASAVHPTTITAAARLLPLPENKLLTRHA